MSAVQEETKKVEKKKGEEEGIRIPLDGAVIRVIKIEQGTEAVADKHKREGKESWLLKGSFYGEG